MRRKKQEEPNLLDGLVDEMYDLARTNPIGMAIVGAILTGLGIWACSATEPPYAALLQTIGGFLCIVGILLLIAAGLWAGVKILRTKAIAPPSADSPPPREGGWKKTRRPGAAPAESSAQAERIAQSPPLRPAPSEPGAAAPARPAPTAPRDGRALERLIAQLFRGMGYSVTETGRHGDGTDGGVDLVCRVLPALAQDSSAPAELRADRGAEVLIQCKDYAKGWVSVDQVRAFFGAVCGWPSSPTRGIFIATCYFSEDAREFATRNNIECLDGPALAAVLKEHDLPLPDGIITEHLKAPAPRLRNNFYARLAAAESTPAAPPRVMPIPYCPKCGVLMVQKNPKKGETWRAFYGCVNFPKCREKVSIA